MDIQVQQLAVCGLVRRADKVLLVHNPRRGWEFPGGIVDMGESLIEALKREIREESGIEARPTAFVGTYSNSARKKGYGPFEGILMPPVHVSSFLCEYISGTETTSDESDDVRWVSETEALEMVKWPTFSERLRDMLAYNGIPVFVKWHIEDQTVVTEDRTYMK